MSDEPKTCICCDEELGEISYTYCERCDEARDLVVEALDKIGNILNELTTELQRISGEPQEETNVPPNEG